MYTFPSPPFSGNMARGRGMLADMVWEDQKPHHLGLVSEVKVFPSYYKHDENFEWW